MSVLTVPVICQSVKIGLAVSAFFAILGLILYSIFNSIIFILLDGGLCVLIIIVSWWREFYLRPRSIIITDDGVRLIFRYKKPRFALWSEITYIYVNASDQSTAFGRFSRGGSLGLKKGNPIHLGPEIAQEVKNKFKERMGSVPPDYYDYYGLKAKSRR